jgi:hypothetical protein
MLKSRNDNTTGRLAVRTLFGAKQTVVLQRNGFMPA